MQAEYLHQWMIAATPDDSPDATNWLKVVAIVQAGFHDGMMDEEFLWQTVVIIPKGKEGLWVTEIVEVLWNAVASLLNRRIMVSISFHDTLRGGTGDRDHRPRGQAAPTAYGQGGGGPLQGIYGYLEGLQCLRPGKGPRTYRRLWGWSQDGSTSLDVLGTPDHGVQCWRLLWTPV